MLGDKEDSKNWLTSLNDSLNGPVQFIAYANFHAAGHPAALCPETVDGLQ